LEFTVGHKDVILILPKTFMNNSGLAVTKALSYYKIDMKGLMIVHDEADMLIGKAKLGFSHSAAGHNGVDSIIQNLKTQSF
jgi:PTH1 family peptidyl-tRNA hydrolase